MRHLLSIADLQPETLRRLAERSNESASGADSPAGILRDKFVGVHSPNHRTSDPEVTFPGGSPERVLPGGDSTKFPARSPEARMPATDPAGSA